MTLIASRWVPAGSGAGAEESLLHRVQASRPEPADARAREILHHHTPERALRLLHLPRTLPGATAVATRLEAAVRAGRRVAIYGDYDADGITATAVLWRVIRAASPGADLVPYVPDRFEEGYGLNAAALHQLAADGVQVVVTVDCGASAVAEARLARDLGLELLVTDHHHVDAGGVAAADAIAHPALPGHEHAPFAELCGAAVAFKVASEFARIWCGGERVADVLRDAVASTLPLVAVGTVADVMPLVDENRIFVAAGLGIMPSTRIAGLSALLRDSQLGNGQRVDASDVGFRLGPRLNAVGRLGHAREAVELLLTEDPVRVREIVARLAELNERRRELDRQAFAQACERIDADPALADAGAIVMADARWHEGVVGIVAAKVAERHGRPAILMAIRDDGTAKGSGRSVDGVDMLATVRASCADLIQRGGGHAHAVGLTVRVDDVPEFARRFADACAAATGGMPIGPVHRYDAEARSQEMTSGAVKALQVLRPFGRGNPAPVFLLRGAMPVAPPAYFGRDRRHVEFTLPGPERPGGVRAVWWGGADRVGMIRQGVPVDLLVRPGIDSYRGLGRVQLEVIDVRPAQAPSR
jgi:single-stranded-DNA-specific exonuclease